MRIRDGCATVTGYKLPQPLVIHQDREGGSEVQAPSQDIGLVVLVVIPRCGINFSVKEKDEASPSCECWRGFAECLHSPICRGVKVFCFLWPSLSAVRRRA